MFELLAVPQRVRQLLLLREVAANFSENYTELINTVRGHCAEIVFVEAGG
jgi:hypothetical protein